MKTILVATDFSTAALNAANYAADMAKAINADLLLWHTYQMPVIHLEAPLAISEEEMKEDGEMNINRLRLQLLERTDNKVKITTEIKIGPFFRELKSSCESIDPYLVVMGSQGTTAVDRFLFGSHVIHAIKHLPWPLITVPPAASFRSIRKIGLACDFERIVDTTPVDEIRSLVKDFNAQLHVLNIRRSEEFEEDVLIQSALLQEMLEPLNPKYHFLIDNDIDRGIIEFTDKNNIDMLVVIPKRHSLLHELVYKSLSKQLVLHSHVPILELHK